MKKQLLGFALMSALFVGCTDESYDLDNISNDFSIGLNEYLPIGHSEVKLKDILNEFKTDYISEDDGGILNFVFDTVTRVDIKPLDITFEKTEFTYDLVADNIYDVKNGIIPANATFTINVPINLNIDDKSGTGRIDEIHIKSGELRFHVESNSFDASALYIKEIPNLDRNGLSWENGSFVLDLSNTYLKFPEGGLVVSCEIGFINKPNSTVKDLIVNDANGIDIKVVMEKTSLTYHRITGYFDSNIEQVEYTDFYINLYDDNLDFKLNVTDPRLEITAYSNSGIPLECSLKKLVGKHKTKKSTTKDSVEAVFYKGTSFEGPSYYFNFQRAENDERVMAFQKEFNHIDGGLDKIFSYLPDSVSLSCGIRIAADTAKSKSYYLLDSTYLDLDIRATVPLQIGDSSYLTIRDTVDKINIVKEITDYQNGEFKLDMAEVIVEFENELPLEAVVNARFCKADTAANGVVTLTEIKNPKLRQSVKIPAAETTSGFVTKAKSSKTVIKVSDDMVEDIKNINAVDFTYRIKVPDGAVDGIFLTTDCGMAAKVYGHVKANITKTEQK